MKRNSQTLQETGRTERGEKGSDTAAFQTLKQLRSEEVECKRRKDHMTLKPHRGKREGERERESKRERKIKEGEGGRENAIPSQIKIKIKKQTTQSRIRKGNLRPRKNQEGACNAGEGTEGFFYA